jgi:glycosyltransferase involved in cell wall biosynthesis
MSDRKRILINAASAGRVFGDGGGAIHKLIGSLVEALRETYAVTLFGDCASVPPGVELIPFSAVMRPRESMTRTPGILKDVLPTSAHLIISTHSINVFSSWLYSRIRQVPWLAWEMDHTPWVPPVGKRTTLHRRLVRQSDRVVVMSSVMRRRILDNGVPGRRITVVYGDIDTDTLTPAGERGRTHSILCVGKFCPRKNQLTLLKAFFHLHGRADMKRYRLCFVGPSSESFLIPGSDSYYRQCREFVREGGLESVVDFKGLLTSDELLEEYRNAAVFVFPTRQEAFGLALLEAMACGLPCLVSNIEPLSELLGGAGVLTSVDDPARLGHDLAELLADAPRRRTLGEVARERARKVFDSGTIRADLLEVVNDMLT